MEVAASTTYAQPETEAIEVNGAKTATVWLEIYKNGSASGSVETRIGKRGPAIVARAA